MAYKLYIEDGEAIPAIQILPDVDPAPAGFTISANPSVDFDSYSNTMLGGDMIKASEIRTEIFDEYTTITWASGSAAQKMVWSKWFVATKAERDTIDSAAVQEVNARDLSILLHNGRSLEAINDATLVLKDAEPADVTNEIQDIEEGSNTIVTSGDGDKFLSNNGLYKSLKFKRGFYAYNMSGAVGTFNGISVGASPTTILFSRHLYKACDKVIEEGVKQSFTIDDRYTDGADLRVTIITTDNTAGGGIRWVAGLTQTDGSGQYSNDTDTEYLGATVTATAGWGQIKSVFTFSGATITKGDALTLIVFRDTQHVDDDLNGDSYLGTVLIEEV